MCVGEILSSKQTYYRDLAKNKSTGYCVLMFLIKIFLMKPNFSEVWPRKFGRRLKGNCLDDAVRTVGWINC